MYRKIIIVAAGIALCMSAMAMPKPSEVKAAISKGDFVTAEALLKQVIVEKPASARAHSDLGAVYAREGKTDLATQEAEIAKKIVADEQSAAEAKKLADAKASSEFMYVLFGLPLAIFVLWVFYVVYRRFREKQETQAEEIAENKEKTSKLLALAKQLEDATLIAKTATYPDTDKAPIVKRISTLQVLVRNMLADLKDGEKTATMSRLSSLESDVETAVYQAANGLPVTPVEDSSDSYSGTFRSHPRHTTESKVWGTPAPVVHNEPAPTVIHHYHETAPAQVAPVIVNNSGNDMLTGMMIGEMMSSHNDRTVIVEHDSYERPSRSSRNDDDDSYSSSSRSSSRDDDSYSSSSSSSSSSDDSYSSSSSSGSDSYSSSDSSSSSDSY